MKTYILQDNTHKFHKGITLLEVVISSFLIGMLTVASLVTTGGVLRTWNQSKVEYDESILAEQLLEEILQMGYTDPDGSNVFGIELDETQSPLDRSEFDDTDDYDNWTESPPQSRNGTPLSGFTGWTCSVDIKKLQQSNPTISLADGNADQGMRRITVTVTGPNGRVTGVSAWRSGAGSSDRSKGIDGDYVVWFGCELKVGANAQTLSSGTNVLNHATLQSP